MALHQSSKRFEKRIAIVLAGAALFVIERELDAELDDSAAQNVQHQALARFATDLRSVLMKQDA